MSQLHLKVVTPEKLLVDEEVSQVNISTEQGQLGILPHHINLMAKLEPGELIIKKHGKVDTLAVGDGFIQVTNNTLDEKDPHIYKNKIVWSDNRNGKFNYDIYLYDLDTKQETQITSQQDTNELYPSIYGDYIVYFKSGKEKNIYL